VNRKNLLDRFDFENNGFFHHDIGPIHSGQANTVMDQRQLDLTLKRQTVARHLMTQAIHINLLQESRADRFMNLDRQPDHAAGEIPRRQPGFLFSASSGHSASSVMNGTSIPCERPRHPRKP